MFVLCTKKEKIRLKPDSLGKDYKKNIKKLLYETYLFKAISENEVIVAIKDVIMYEGYVEQVTGEVVFEIQMTYLVQQIFQNEVYEGNIVSQNPKGITDLDSSRLLLVNIYFNQTQPSLRRKTNGFGKMMKKIAQVSSFMNQVPKLNLKYALSILLSKNHFLKQKLVAKIDEVNPEGQKQIIGSMNEDGLGLVQWWDFS